MAAELTEAFPGIEIGLIPGSGGIFVVTLDGALVFSKKQVGRHAQPGEIIEAVRTKHARG